MEFFEACPTFEQDGTGPAYLRNRGCELPPADGDLRWHSDHKHPSGWNGTCLVGLITDALTAEPVSLHRTWCRPDGSKAPIDRPRLLLANHRAAGGVVRLTADADVVDGLTICEGIESGLSAGSWPLWACLSAGSVAAFPVLDGIEAITVIADNDKHKKGEDAAHRCGSRWAEAGREVRIWAPPQPGTDANSYLAGKVA